MFYKQVEMIETHNDASGVDVASIELNKMQHHLQGKDFPYTLIPET